ncbi:MAG: amidohydrolase family protein [Promethearchaeota archaeon]
MPNETIPTWTRNISKPGSLSQLFGSKYPIFDAHLHVVNFIQETPGGEALIEAMDRANVRKAVIFGLPVSKMWTEYDRDPPNYYLANDSKCYYYAYTDVIVAEMVCNLPEKQRKRLFPLLCGFNPIDKYGIRDVKRLFNQYPDVWCGIGELLLRHDDLTALTYGDTARANHRALWPVYEFASKHDLPVLMHQNVTSVSKSDYPVYLYELEDVLRDFPRTRFILAHCGISRRLNVPFYHQMVERLLDQYDRLFVDFSWIIYDVVICPNDNPQKDWIELTERYSDRICLGSDLVTRFERMGPELKRYDVFLDQLSEKSRENICWKTAERIYNRKNRKKL